MLGKKSGPVIEYSKEAELDTTEGESTVTSTPTGRTVAKKSTAGRKTAATCTTRWETENAITQVVWTVKERSIFCSHSCNTSCVSNIQHQYREEEHRGTNPLFIPLIVGWDRQITKHSNEGRRRVFYIAPCGRRLSSLEDIHKYIKETDLLLEMDFFNFDCWLHVLNEFKPQADGLGLILM